MFAFLRPIALWLAVTILSILLIFSNDNPQIRHLKGRTTDLISIGTRPFARLLSFSRIWRENQRLRDLLADLSLQIAEENEIRVENRRLREMLEFRSRSPFKMLPSNVVGFGGDPGLKSLILDRGESDGVIEFMPVIAVEGVVGLIYQVGARSSVVQLINDVNIGVAARLIPTREMGIVHSDKRGVMWLDGIPVSVRVQPGDTVLTSGMGGVFPPGFLIGRVAAVTPSNDEWLWRIEVQPAVDFERTEALYIILNRNVD